MKVAILRDSNPESSLKWEIACQNKNFDFLPVDLLRNDWLAKLKDFDPDFCVCRPPGDIKQNKAVFDTKLYIIENHTPYRVYPSFHETVIYENKATLAFFLQINEIPHPLTFVSYSLDEAQKFIDSSSFPVVAKTLIGAAGSGIKILKNKDQALAYVQKAFTSGIKRRYGPNRKTGSPSKWLMKTINSPRYFLKKLREYNSRDKDVQKDVVLFQEFIPHEFEWRCVKIGSSYFAYKKLKIGEKASGSKMFEYGVPPIELLDFTKKLCERFNFNFMAVDLFNKSDAIFVNELQTIFGHKNPYICKVNDKPGRFLFEHNDWIFEEGDFNTNESYDLRLETAISLYEQSQK
jgi:glutathione synthase/RimK-type ligase-like ATP-grasp enzyme